MKFCKSTEEYGSLLKIDQVIVKVNMKEKLVLQSNYYKGRSYKNAVKNSKRFAFAYKKRTSLTLNM